MSTRLIYWLLAIACAVASARAEVMLRGRVTDQLDRPIEGAQVSAFAPAMGQTLVSAQQQLLTARSDATGRFEIRLPFADLRYGVLAELAGHENFWQTILVTNSRDVDIRMPEAGTKQKIQGRIYDADDRPAANLEVALIGEIGYSAKTATRDDGAFAFDDVPEYIGQAVLLATRDGLVLPQFIVHQRPARGHLKLVNGAMMHGTLIDAATGGPVISATVTARTDFMSGFSRAVSSDERGRWEIKDLPPGQFILIAEGPEHYGRRTFDPSHDNTPIELAAGAALNVPVKLDRKAMLSGAVVDSEGRSVAEAMVGVAFVRDPQFNERDRFVRTDAAGRFTIATAIFRDELSLGAFHARQGLAKLSLKPLRPGERRENLHLQLSGSTRIIGTVTDEADKPLEHVMLEAPWLSSMTTESGGEGRFDFGRIPLATDAKANSIHAKPPRPRGGTSILTYDRPTIPAKEVAGRTFYQDADVPFAPPASPDEHVAVKVVLKPTELLVFSGRVVDETDKAPAEASVHVFAGTADANWVYIAAPRFTDSYSHSSSAMQVGQAVCLADGRYRVYAVRDDGESVDGGTRYTLGIVVGNDGRKLVKDVIVPLGKREIVTDVRLDPKPAAARARTERP